MPGAALQWSGSMLAHLITLPYYRFFRQNTLIPIQSIARAIENGQDDFTILKILGRWKERKLYELHFIQIAVSSGPCPGFPNVAEPKRSRQPSCLALSSVVSPGHRETKSIG